MALIFSVDLASTAAFMAALASALSANLLISALAAVSAALLDCLSLFYLSPSFKVALDLTEAIEYCN